MSKKATKKENKKIIYSQKKLKHQTLAKKPQIKKHTNENVHLRITIKLNLQLFIKNME